MPGSFYTKGRDDEEGEIVAYLHLKGIYSILSPIALTAHMPIDGYERMCKHDPFCEM